MSPCPVCGGNRDALKQTRTYTIWSCPTCGIGREELINGVQESFDRRTHP